MKSKPVVLVKALCAAEHVPYADMEQLIGQGQANARAREEVLGTLRDMLADGGDETAMAWLVIVAGELGRDGALVVLEAASYEEEGDILGEAVASTLPRCVKLVLHETLREVHRATGQLHRAGLYEALDGAVVSGDDATRARLLTGWTWREVAGNLGRLFEV